MKVRLAPATFSIAFCIGYAAFFYLNHPMFLYYPVSHQWVWGRVTTAIVQTGPPIVWYGLIANATVVASLAAVLLPDRRIFSFLSGWLWIFPCAAAVVCLFLLRVFFL